MKKDLAPTFFKVSIDHLFDDLEPGKESTVLEKSMENVLNFESKNDLYEPCNATRKIQLTIDFEMLVFRQGERRNTRSKNPQRKGRELTTNSAQLKRPITVIFLISSCGANFKYPLSSNIAPYPINWAY